MSDNAKAAGLPRPLADGTATYDLKPLVLRDYCAFEAWLEAQAFAGVERARANLSRAAFEDYARLVSQDVATQQYAWGGQEFGKAVRTVPGVRKLLELSAAGGIDEADADRLARTRTADVVAALFDLNPELR